jgi:hypothetical protein
MADARFLAGAIHENAPHGLGRGAEEMASAVPGPLVIGAHQAQPRFMDQRGRLEGLPGGFTGHALRRQPAEFPINQREQLRGSGGIALLNPV